MSFLPTDYDVPVQGGNYMKFKPGDNKFRIISSPIIGYEWWEEENGNRIPRRVTTMREAVEIGIEPIKHFWAMVVFDREDSKLKILEITQKSIMKSIKALSKDEDWGNPKGNDGYDISITREGEGMETRYEVNPKPKRELAPEVLKMVKETKIDLSALYRGEDPFEDE